MTSRRHDCIGSCWHVREYVLARVSHFYWFISLPLTTAHFLMRRFNGAVTTRRTIFLSLSELGDRLNNSNSEDFGYN